MIGIVAKKKKELSLFNHRSLSVFARKKKKGRTIFKASPKSLLSAIIVLSGPYTRNAPPDRIIPGRLWRTRRPKDPAMARASHRRRFQLSIMPTVTAVIRRIFETILQWYQASAVLSAKTGS